MTTPSTDPVAAELAAIAERNEAYIAMLRLTEWTVEQEPCGAVRRLLKALQAALKVADGLESTQLGSCVEVQVLDGKRVRAAISAALTGEEGKQ